MIQATDHVQPNTLYVIQPGDTLRDIALRAFGDPGRWAEIWRANPQIGDNELEAGTSLIIPRWRP